ncbi:hypothetical protein [Homoserinibacter gongjuensis]|uniref:Transposase DDE domain-containing protein n=1 Tax=Homoserinibacter gongjuensis TaxID=1162968 RepID=A0ABQ6JVP8_9MICO|nr:hypothetical protein [Homoserinibacter gongjuensis]GMA90711.1 hypothetical protein GCM10025869_12400 [Homoserinibacter gongjuensis]
MPDRDASWSRRCRHTRTPQLGKAASHDRFILVEGQWYLDTMTTTSINAVQLYQEELEKIAAERLPRPEREKRRAAANARRDARLASREQYRLKPKGRPRPDGRQQYILPEDHELTITTATGARKQTTVMFPPAEILYTGKFSKQAKLQQRYPYKSHTWKRWYGLRSTVEHVNSHIKNSSHEDAANAGRRGGRGYAYQYLMATLAVVSGNIRKIITFLNRLEGPRKSTSPFRAEKSARAKCQEAKKQAWLIKMPQDGRTTRFPNRT